MRPKGPYLLFCLDDTLATYAGVSPEEPIGEPYFERWNLIRRALKAGFYVKVLTWRDPGLVYAWMERAKLQDISADLFFEVTNEMPKGLPNRWAVPRYGTMVDIEDLVRAKERS